MSDIELLQRYLEGDEAAFAEVVRRHVAWVHGMARRRTGDAHVAEDVAQAVFMALAEQAPRLRRGTVLAAWLFRITQRAVGRALRGEYRRRRHEREAAMQRLDEGGGFGVSGPASAEWAELAPMLDEMVGRLRQSDREAILLRFYRGMTFAEVGAALGTSEEAARKRVERAVGKLRELAQRRGISMTATGLAGVLWAQMAAEAATPPGLVGTVMTVALGKGTAAGAGSSAALGRGLATMTATTKATAAVVMGVLICLIGGAAILAIELVDWRSSPMPVNVVAEEMPPAAPAPTNLELYVGLEKLDVEPAVEAPRIRLHYREPLRPEGPLPPAGDVAELSPGANRVDLSGFPDGSHIV